MRFLGMTYQQATWVFVGVQLAIVEGITFALGDPPLTQAMRSGAGRWMLWPALFGLFSGHFFGQKGGPRWGPGVLLLMVLAVAYRDLFLRDPVPRDTHLEVCLLFLGAGAWLWGSR
jgi:hypothetical protein